MDRSPVLREDDFFDSLVEKSRISQMHLEIVSKLIDIIGKIGVLLWK